MQILPDYKSALIACSLQQNSAEMHFAIWTVKKSINWYSVFNSEEIEQVMV